MGPKPELKATGQTTNILGFACQQYEVKQRGETLEIWATDQLLPFQPYVRNQPHRFGPQMLEEQWPGLLTAKKFNDGIGQGTASLRRMPQEIPRPGNPCVGVVFMMS